MFKIGPKTRKGVGSSMPEASADDPIYTRGFAVGVTRPSDSTKPSEAQTESSSNPQEGMEMAAGSALNEVLMQGYRDMEARKKADDEDK